MNLNFVTQKVQKIKQGLKKKYAVIWDRLILVLASNFSFSHPNQLSNGQTSHLWTKSWKAQNKKATCTCPKGKLGFKFFQAQWRRGDPVARAWKMGKHFLSGGIEYSSALVYAHKNL